MTAEGAAFDIKAVAVEKFCSEFLHYWDWPDWLDFDWTRLWAVNSSLTILSKGSRLQPPSGIFLLTISCKSVGNLFSSTGTSKLPYDAGSTPKLLT